MAKKPPASEPQKEWPADKVERWPTDKLVPYARNSRQHSDAQIAQIAGSIREWGWTIPVLVGEDGVLIAGHARVLAARKLGIKEIPTMVARGWSDAQKRAYCVADNKLALNSTFDNDMLIQELGDITTDGFNLSIVGFSPQEMDALLGLKNADEGPAEDAGESAYKEQYAVIVSCKSEPDQERIYNELTAQGYACRVVAT